MVGSSAGCATAVRSNEWRGMLMLITMLFSLTMWRLRDGENWSENFSLVIYNVRAHGLGGGYPFLEWGGNVGISGAIRRKWNLFPLVVEGERPSGDMRLSLRFRELAGDSAGFHKSAN